MRSLRSRGFENSKMPSVLIEIQLSADMAESLRWAKVLGWIRKIRRRYRNTGGVEYRVFLNLPDR